MNFSVEHIGLPARNPTALKDWYLRTLDGQIVFESGTTPPAYFVRIGGAMLEIYEGDFSAKETSDNKCNGFRHLALRVETIEAARKELEGRGVHFKEDVKPAGGGGRVLFFQDSEGNLLHLVERPSESVFDR